MLTNEQRTQALEQALAWELAHGARLESRTAGVAIVATGTPTNHVLHVILSVLTFGLWLPVWVILAFSDRPKRFYIWVDENDKVVKLPL